MSRSRALSLSVVLLSACTINKYYAAPPSSEAPPATAPAAAAWSAPGPVAPAPDPVAPPPGPATPATPAKQAASPASPASPASAPSTGVVEVIASRAPSDDALAAANEDLARRFTIPKRFLIEQRAQLSIYTDRISRIGTPDAFAPILEMADGGFLLIVDQHAGELVRHPAVIRLDRDGRVAWRLALPREPRFETYETNGAVLAPDGSAFVVTIPFANHVPRPPQIAKVSADGRLVWSTRLREDRGVHGPFPLEVRVAADGGLELAGWASYLREQEKGSSEPLRRWVGSLTASGRPGRSTIGEVWPASDRFQPHHVHTFWHDLYRP